MRTLKITTLILALLVLTTQAARHVYCLASQFNGISRRQNVRDSLARYAAGRSRNASSFAFASRAQACQRGS